MRIRPLFLDSRPGYLGGRGRSGSLLLVPLGPRTLFEHLRAWLEPLTPDPPLVVSAHEADDEYGRWIRAVCPTANVATTPDEVADVVAGYELSDALLIIDPRCLPVRARGLSSLLQHHSVEPRVAHHLVAFKCAVAGTKERVSFDAAGHIRRILRHYEPSTWSFIKGVPATLVPIASGILADGVIPESLADLRQQMVARGLPSRDVALKGGALDLTEEAGLLVANEHLVRQATGSRKTRSTSAGPLYVGEGHLIHKTARLAGPVVIHPGVHVDENAMIVGPAVIGAGARISARAVVAHAVVVPGSAVPCDQTVSNRVWPENAGDRNCFEHEPLSYDHRLARVIEEARSDEHDDKTEGSRSANATQVRFKRAIDVTADAHPSRFARPSTAPSSGRSGPNMPRSQAPDAHP